MDDDNTFFCRVAKAAGLFWDFVDKRDIDKHAMAWAVVIGTIKITLWSLAFATTSTKAGTDIAAILATIWVPWSSVQGFVVKWYFATDTGVKPA